MWTDSCAALGWKFMQLSRMIAGSQPPLNRQRAAAPLGPIALCLASGAVDMAFPLAWHRIGIVLRSTGRSETMITRWDGDDRSPTT